MSINSNKLFSINLDTFAITSDLFPIVSPNIISRMMSYINNNYYVIITSAETFMLKANNTCELS